MTLKIVFSEDANDDLYDLFKFIARHNPQRARTYISDIRQACTPLKMTPLMGIARPDLGREVRLHTILRKVVVLYVATPDEIRVLRIFTGGRNYRVVTAAPRPRG